MTLKECENCMSLVPEKKQQRISWYCAELNCSLRVIKRCPSLVPVDSYRLKCVLEEIGL